VSTTSSPANQKVSWFHSLQTKFILAFISAIGAVLLLLNTYPLLVSQDLVFQSKQNSLQSQVSVLSSSLSVFDILTADNINQTMEVLQNDGSIRILITDASGLILYDSAGDKLLYRYALFSEIYGALSGQDISLSKYRNGTFITCACSPIVCRGVITGSVYLHELDATQGALLMGLQSTLRTLSLIVCVLVLILSLAFSSAVTRRISALLRAIGLVREGNYSHRIVLRGHDELALLADEFNGLTGRLQVTEEVRRRFVSDASHELKTPLASIRLLSDSILQSPEIDPDTTREFVSDIGEEADRLTRISEKLLTLTRLDAASAPESVPVDVAFVIQKVAHMLRPLSTSNRISLELDLEENCVILATDDDLYQIAFNLIENAIKYNRPNGTVFIRLFAEGDTVCLQVADTGVGIPEEDMPKIFDRFYRVDKARSRAAGGTGLGLSIVRDTILQHGGDICVAARAPEGTVFTVTFPRLREVQP